MTRHTLQLTVNDEPVTVDVPAHGLLADLLRDELGLTGTKRGCETGVCGACTVLVDGKALKSCLSLAVQHDGAQVVTIEGLGSHDRLHPLQESFMRCGGLQCGYCTPGFIMTASAMLADNPSPTTDDVRHGLSGNLCRCTGYTQIVESILNAAENLRGN